MFFDTPQQTSLFTEPYTGEKFTEKKAEFMSNDEIANSSGDYYVLDIETFPNLFQIGWKHLKSGKYVVEYISDVLDDFVTGSSHFIARNCKVISFNGNNYDIWMLHSYFRKQNLEYLYAQSCFLINAMRMNVVADLRKEPLMIINHIDLFDPAPDPNKTSLKTYASRMHATRMQDLPYPPDERLTTEQAIKVIKYNINDLDVTHQLWDMLAEVMDVRIRLSDKYHTDLRSKSDAQIAEAVIIGECEKKLGRQIIPPRYRNDYQFTYELPAFLNFNNPLLLEIKQKLQSEIKFTVIDGKVLTPKYIKEKTIKMGSGEYNLCIGGLHSKEKDQAITVAYDELLFELDVASYYPNIILNQSLFPDHIGPEFLETYRDIVNERLDAKRKGNKVISECLKIVINGGFGKLGSQYSRFYSPQLMVQVTLSGQLVLLMLIDWLETAGISVVSANTDGIVVHCKKDQYDTVMSIARLWEERTKFELEETRYKGLYSRDVNSYIAVKEGGGYKTKGFYGIYDLTNPADVKFALQKNRTGQIVNKAIANFLDTGKPVEDTINECTDFQEFVKTQAVRGGGHKEGIKIGKVVRYYYSNATDTGLLRCENNNKVPDSVGAMPCMEMLREVPRDLDRQEYINRAKLHISKFGFNWLNV